MLIASPKSKMPHSMTPAEAVERRQRGGARPAVVVSRQSLTDELEAAIIQRDIASRAEILRRITDLFAAGSASFGREQTSLFDDVMGRLVS